MLEGPDSRGLCCLPRGPQVCERDSGQEGTDLRRTVSALGQGMVGFQSHRDWNPPKLTTSMQKTHANMTELSRNRVSKSKPEAFLPPHHNVQALEGQGPSGRALPPLPQGAQRAQSRYLQSGPQPGLVPRLSWMSLLMKTCICPGESAIVELNTSLRHFVFNQTEEMPL